VRPIELVGIVLVLVLAPACDSADRREAEGVATAIVRFRSVDLAATPAAVEALKKTTCTKPEICAARDACVVAGDAMSRAIALKDEVARSLAAVESGALAKDSPEAQGLTPKLDEAEAALRKGQAAIPTCEEQLQALKRRYRL
jgi:hypothetical protein